MYQFQIPDSSQKSSASTNGITKLSSVTFTKVADHASQSAAALEDNDQEDLDLEQEIEESKFCTLPRSGPNAFTIRQVNLYYINLKREISNFNHFSGTIRQRKRLESARIFDRRWQGLTERFDGNLRENDLPQRTGR